MLGQDLENVFQKLAESGVRSRVRTESQTFDEGECLRVRVRRSLIDGRQSRTIQPKLAFNERDPASLKARPRRRAAQSGISRSLSRSVAASTGGFCEHGGRCAIRVETERITSPKERMVVGRPMEPHVASGEGGPDEIVIGRLSRVVLQKLDLLGCLDLVVDLKRVPEQEAEPSLSCHLEVGNKRAKT
jgi:hypothetical protein